MSCPKTAGLPVVNVHKRNFLSKKTFRLIGLSLLDKIVKLLY